MTTGGYLRQLLENKGLSVRETAQIIGVKSRNVIYRLFNNYYSAEKTRSFVDKITTNIEFSSEEKERLYATLAADKASNYLIEARRVMREIYNERISSEGFSWMEDKEIFYLKDMLNGCKGIIRCIFCANLNDAGMIKDLCDFLDNNREASVFNYLHFRNHSLMSAYEIMSLITLSRYKNYMPFISEQNTFKGICVVYENTRGYNICKLECVDKSWLYVDTEISGEYYLHILKKTELYNDACSKVKEPVKKVVDYIDIISESLIFDEGRTFYSEGAPCFGNLTYEIMYEMFEDINYLGFPKEHPYVQELIRLFRERADKFLLNPESGKKFLFDEEHIRHMLETGISFDHAEQFKPMKPDQLKRYFRGIIDKARNNPDKLSFRFVKDGISLSRPYVYGNDRMFYLYYSETGYMDGFSIMINNHGIFEIMNDFTEYIWNEYTLSDEESIVKLEEMMKKYIRG